MWAASARGECALNGFRNRDLREWLHGGGGEPQERRRRSAQVTRQLRLLRAHGLLRKVPRTQRYQLTARGRLLTSALAAATRANARKLTELAA